MSTPAAFLTVAAVLLVSVPFAYWQIQRAMSVESERDRIIREARATTRVWDPDTAEWVELPPGVKPGPGQLPEDEVAEIRELRLAFEAPAYDPHLAAGCERLWDAIRDQQNGDQT